MGKHTEIRRAAAKARWDRTTAEERLAHALMMQAAIQQRWYDEVDPNGELPEAEREVLAQQARALYYGKVQAKRRMTIERKRAAAEAADGASGPAEPEGGDEGVA